MASPSENGESKLSQQVQFLQDILKHASAAEDETAADSLVHLLRQLDEADDIAQDVENKFDKLLENLDGMIEQLEKNKHPNDQTNEHSSDEQTPQTD